MGSRDGDPVWFHAGFTTLDPSARTPAASLYPQPHC